MVCFISIINNDPGPKPVNNTPKPGNTARSTQDQKPDRTCKISLEQEQQEEEKQLLRPLQRESRQERAAGRKSLK